MKQLKCQNCGKDTVSTAGGKCRACRGVSDPQPRLNAIYRRISKAREQGRGVRLTYQEAALIQRYLPSDG